MRSAAIRRSFLEFFEERGHRVTPSAPLVPHGDATLLFVNAGMVPFKNYFLGAEEPPARRAASVQKCMRVSGKHNDLENVGPSHRHHTFFEMLGNFSFGDYFKEDAVRFGWELVTEVWGIPEDRLFATVFEEDDEAEALWLEHSSLPAERVLRRGAKDNFWAMGDTGPCGPCSEIFVDLHPELPAVDWEAGCDDGRYLEIWNLVFMQFDRAASGETTPLPDPSIDTGAGLERVAAVLQKVESNYASDLFRPLLEATAELSGHRYGEDLQTDVAFRVIADHLRAVSFLLADGVIPSNEGRGYVLRRILRRAVRYGMSLGLEDPFLGRLLPAVSAGMGDAYPELERAAPASTSTVAAEEEKFLGTLAVGSRRVQDAIEAARSRGDRELDGAVLFKLYDTYGLPLEILREIAEEESLGLDEEGFERELDEQRSRSRAATGDSRQKLSQIRDAIASAGIPETDFVGYDRTELDGAKVLALYEAGAESGESLERLDRPGQRAIAVVDRTPLYAEAGGQLGDRGTLVWPGGEAGVEDVQQLDRVSLHWIVLVSGTLAVGDSVTARVELAWREPTEANHTATHLLHAALRHVLGDGVRQAGSLVAPDRLRFDFTFGRPLEEGEIREVEDLVNLWIRRAAATEIVADRPFEEAREAGAMALFGEKYGDRVRTVGVPPLALGAGGQLQSLELCGGCHVANTGRIGLFTVVAERGVASGVRRIEARTGVGAIERVRQRDGLLERAAGALSVAPEALPEEVAAALARRKELERELSSLRLKAVTGVADGTGSETVEVAGVPLLVREVPPAPTEELRSMADVLRAKLGRGIVVLGTRADAKVGLLVAVSDDLVERAHAGKLVSRIAQLVGGRGGGRANFAQAGGKEVGRLDEALAAVPGLVREQLENGGEA